MILRRANAQRFATGVVLPFEFLVARVFFPKERQCLVFRATRFFYLAEFCPTDESPEMGGSKLGITAFSLLPCGHFKVLRCLPWRVVACATCLEYFEIRAALGTDGCLPYSRIGNTNTTQGVSVFEPLRGSCASGHVLFVCVS